MRNRNPSDSELWTILLLFLAFLFGGLVRFAPAIFSDFPINDGGMFQVMTEELRDHDYRLPDFTHYNGLHISFAYPPLGFYLAALLASLFRAGMSDIFLWLPAILSTLSIPAFYLMSRAMLGSSPKGALATLFFALLPRSFSWFLMGGGVTRSLGQLFLLLTAYSVFMVFARGSRRHLWLSIIFGGLAVLSHPETIIHTVATCLLVVLFYLHRRGSILKALTIALGVSLVSSPWWLTVVLRHGLEPFLVASQTGGHNAFFWVDILFPIFSEERYITLVTVLGLIGLGAQLLKRRFFLPLWLALPFLVEPRSAFAIAIIPQALLAALAISEVVVPSLAAGGNQGEAGDWIETGMKRMGMRILLGYAIIVILIGSFGYSLGLSGFHLRADDRAAMDWVRGNTPSDSRFILVTGVSQPFSDPAQEWFPVLGERKSQSTIQGLEWVLGGRLEDRLNELLALQACANREADCLSAWAEDTGLDFDYVFVKRYELVISYKTAALPEVPALLLTSLRQSPDYELVYESETIFIFRVTTR